MIYGNLSNPKIMFLEDIKTLTNPNFKKRKKFDLPGRKKPEKAKMNFEPLY